MADNEVLRIDEVIFDSSETPNYFRMIYDRTREAIKKKRAVYSWEGVCVRLNQRKMVAHGPDDHVYHHHGRTVYSVVASTLESDEIWSIARLEISIDDGYYRLLRIFPEQGPCQCFMGLWTQSRDCAPITVAPARMEEYRTETKRESEETLGARVKGTVADKLLEEINSRVDMLAELGYSIMITTQHQQPLAMGNYRQFAEVYPNRRIYRPN